MHNMVEVLLGLNSKAASIISEYSSIAAKRRHIKSFYKSDLTWTALFLAYHQPRLVAGLRQHAVSVTLNQMKMGIVRRSGIAQQRKKRTTSS